MDKLKNLCYLFYRNFSIPNHYFYDFAYNAAPIKKSSKNIKSISNLMLAEKSEDALLKEVSSYNKKRNKARIRNKKLSSGESEKKMYFLNYSSKSSGSTKAEADAYTKATSQVTDGQGVFSRNLQFIGIIILGIIVIIFAIGSYLNTKNPLTPIINSTIDPFTINFLDKNNAKIFSISSKTAQDVKIADVSPSLFEALLALHGILETKSGTLLEDTTDTDTNNDTNNDTDNDTDTVQLSTSESNEDILVAENSLPEQQEQAKSFSKVCSMYTNLSQFSESSCKYSYPSFLINVFANLTTKDTSLLTKIVNKSDALRNYLLRTWVQTHVDVQKFLEVYFNYVYYGHNTLGINSASLSYFDVPASLLSYAQSVIMMKTIFDNNKIIYPNYDISYDEIINQLAIMGLINDEEQSSIKKEVASFTFPVAQVPILNFLDDMFIEGYKYYKEVPVANVRTSIISSIQNTSISMASEKLKGKNIPHASIFITSNDSIITSYVFSLDENEKPVFYKGYPTPYVYNTLKPLIYLSLLENKKDTNSILLENKYRNLIFSKQRAIRMGITNVDDVSLQSLPQEGKATPNPLPSPSASLSLNSVTKTDLDIVPSRIRNLFAEQLYTLETQYIASLDVDSYKRAFKALGINTDVESVEDIIVGNITVSFSELFKFYNALSQGGRIHNLSIIDFVNKDPIIINSSNLPAVNQTFVDTMKSLFLSKIESRSSSNNFYLITDFSTAFAISNEYTIGVWLGDLHNPNLADDYSEDVESLVINLVKLLQ